MARSWTVGGVLLAAIIVSGLGPRKVSAAHTDVDPDAVAERCIARVEALADRCVAHNEALCERIVAAIQKALANGNDRLAQRIAEVGRRVLDRHTEACVKLIEALCRHCVHVLERLGADELAQRVKGACEDAIAKVQASRDRCLEKIAEALEGDGDGGGGTTAASSAARGR